MARTVIIIPIGTSVGLTSVSLGLINSLEQQGLSVGFMKPISKKYDNVEHEVDRSVRIISKNTNASLVDTIDIETAESYISHGETDILLEKIVENHRNFSENEAVIVVEGMMPNRKNPYVNSINYEMAKALNAEIILLTNHGNTEVNKLRDHIEASAIAFGGKNNPNILGVIINKLNAPTDEEQRTRPDLLELYDSSIHHKVSAAEVKTAFATSPLNILACIPWNADLIAIRVRDIVEHLGATIINEGDMDNRRINNITFCARSIPNMLEYFKSETLLVSSADRPEVIIAASLAVMNGIKIGAILLNSGYKLDSKVTKLCQEAFDAGLPVFRTEGNTWQTALNLQNISLEVHSDDKERIDAIKQYISNNIGSDFIAKLAAKHEASKRLSPPAFRYQLTSLAKKANKKIVLPEGDEPRTIKAAAICAERKIAECVLLGKEDKIKQIAESLNVTLGAGIQIIDPDAVRENYVPRLVELRKSKGMTPAGAREQLEDTVVLGTMMLEANEVDGLVSGAVHTTANTIRPPLQLIKTAPGSSLVSSVFFMLLPEQVLVYGDCAINPDPDAEALAEIAIQSADSAAAFGIEPKVAMISYSTGASGTGADVEKVREATEIVKLKRPDLIVDGPLQYDAAIMEDVAKSKAPNSPVAGQANVFIFPDLNTGNTTYKAVQRSADLISIGPMLQGMRKPVNDLSRGALVDDIVYTIALTAIQATQQ